METNLGLTTALRLLLLYAHLLLCVFALYTVLNTDWQLLRSRISAKHLLQAHRRVVLLLAGLWISGLAIVAVDGLAQMGTNPKLLAKLVCVSLLTLNGLLLRHWCFPRLVSSRPLQRAESWALMSCGAVSTTCWLMSGFYGIARPLALWSPGENLLLLWAALAVAVPVALALSSRLREGRRLRQHSRALSLPPGRQPLKAAQRDPLALLQTAEAGKTGSALTRPRSAVERPAPATQGREVEALHSRLPSL